MIRRAAVAAGGLTLLLCAAPALAQQAHDDGIWVEASLPEEDHGTR